MDCGKTAPSRALRLLKIRKQKGLLCRRLPDCYHCFMTFGQFRLGFAVSFVQFGMLAGCAQPPAPQPRPAAELPAPPAPSLQLLHSAWLKGYEAGFYEGRRDQERRDQALLAQSTLPPPPPPAPSAAPAPAQPAPPVPVPVPALKAPPQSVFVPAGPAEPVTSNP